MTGNQLVQYLRNGYGILVSKHNYKQILKLIESEDPNLKTSADEPITKLNPFYPYSLDLSVIYIVSMGPRHYSRGNTSVSFVYPFTKKCFNGATTLQSWKQ